MTVRVRAYVNWIPAAFLRARRDELVRAFPGWRAPEALAEPMRAVDAPELPPLPFVPFRARGQVTDAVGAVVRGVLEVARPSDRPPATRPPSAAPGPRDGAGAAALDALVAEGVLHPALVGDALAFGVPVALFRIDPGFRDALAEHVEPGGVPAAPSAGDLGRDPPWLARWMAATERSADDVRRDAHVLAKFAREAARDAQDLVLWVNAR